MNETSFHDAVRLRHSCRAFLAEEIPEKILAKVLEDAQFSPSNCNTQPWSVHIVSGEKLKGLTKKLIDAHQTGQFSPDFSFDIGDYSGIYKQRQSAQGRVYYEGLGVAREDKEGRDEASIKNYRFYDAPHVALLFMPDTGDNVRVAGDIGMYGQTFLLSLAAHGLAGVPQTVLGFFAALIREYLDIPNHLKMLFGISFGYADVNAKANSIRMGRDQFAANVRFHS